MFLAASDVSIGSVATAPSWSLVFLRREPENPLLIFGTGDARQAIFLNGEHGWDIIQASKLERWIGAIVKDVRLEIELPFTRDPEAYQAGMVRMGGGGLEFCGTIGDQMGFRDREWVSLFADDPLAERDPQPFENYVHFDTWRIVSDSSERPKVWCLCKEGTVYCFPTPV